MTTDAPSAELASRLRDPVNLALNASLLVATIAIVAPDGLEALSLQCSFTPVGMRQHSHR